MSALVFCLVFLVFLPGAHAQGNDEDAVIEVRSEPRNPELEPDRATSSISRKALREQLPQSLPSALRFSPGVFVQQTAHGQGSPYIRGRTGQQTLLLFDGLRLNHALFRKGPNQYLFTVDRHAVDHIDVVRTSASVEYGNDAISGAVLISPLEPALDPTTSDRPLRQSFIFQHRTADGEVGGRAELDMQFGSQTAVLIGLGGRTVGQLQAGGKAFSEADRPGGGCEDILTVPCFEDDGFTQRGTGFDELTADARAVWQSDHLRLVGALYLYRQFDAPRTDQCPPPEAAVGECLVFDEQFRTHGYLRIEGEARTQIMSSYRGAVSYQRQHQRSSLNRPDRNPGDEIDTRTTNRGRDAVDGLSTFFKGRTSRLQLTDDMYGDMRYGIDGSHEWVESRKWIEFAQPAVTRAFSRGQYVEGATYSQTGAFIAPAIQVGSLRVRSGARVSFIKAESPGDPQSSSASFAKNYSPVVFNGGLKWGDNIALILDVEQGFRAPNLDDLTARQSTGQGYQLENPSLEPEHSLTTEAGMRVKNNWFSGDIFIFRQMLENTIEREVLNRDACTLDENFTDQACRANRAPLRLTNLAGTAVVQGAEGRFTLSPMRAIKLRSVVSYARGEGDMQVDGNERRLPLSRIPPLNGYGEVRYERTPWGLWTSLICRWAAKQDQLSPGDEADARIPAGGTPGYAVMDIRAGIKINPWLRTQLAVENITDQRYRAHGSGVLGPGRGVAAEIRAEL